MADELAEPEFVEATGGVDQHIALRRESGEEINLVDQRDVLDDDGIGLDHRLPRTDWMVVNPAEGHDWRAHAFGSEAREGLRVATLGERSHGQDLCGGHHTLATAPMDTHLEHGHGQAGPVCRE